MIQRLKQEKLNFHLLEEIGIFKFKKFFIILRGHNGLKSIVQQIKSNDFEKIKIGIGRPNSKDPDVVANYCLSNFPSGKNKNLKT